MLFASFVELDSCTPKQSCRGSYAFFYPVAVLTAAILFFLFHLLEIFDRRSKPQYHLLQPDYSALPCCLSKGEKKRHNELSYCVFTSLHQQPSAVSITQVNVHSDLCVTRTATKMTTKITRQATA